VPPPRSRAAWLTTSYSYPGTRPIARDSGTLKEAIIAAMRLLCHIGVRDNPCSSVPCCRVVTAQRNGMEELPARAIPGEIYLERLAAGAPTSTGGKRLSMDSSPQHPREGSPCAAYKEVMHAQ
jgi:hypothetical protein